MIIKIIVKNKLTVRNYFVLSAHIFCFSFCFFFIYNQIENFSKIERKTKKQKKNKIRKEVMDIHSKVE